MPLGPGSFLSLYLPDNDMTSYLKLPYLHNLSQCPPLVLCCYLERPSLCFLLPRHPISAGQSLFCKALDAFCTQSGDLSSTLI
jgi:hypothetical protein